MGKRYLFESIFDNCSVINQHNVFGRDRDDLLNNCLWFCWYKFSLSIVSGRLLGVSWNTLFYFLFLDKWICYASRTAQNIGGNERIPIIFSHLKRWFTCKSDSYSQDLQVSLLHIWSVCRGFPCDIRILAISGSKICTQLSFLLRKADFLVGTGCLDYLPGSRCCWFSFGQGRKRLKDLYGKIRLVRAKSRYLAKIKFSIFNWLFIYYTI